MASTKRIPAKKSSTKEENAFLGIVLGIFEDEGPVARYNNSGLLKEVVNKMVVHGTSAVHGGEDMLGGLFGPLPVIGKKDLRYLIFTFKAIAINTNDSRIEEFGRVCSIFLILKENQERYALNNHLTIEKILTDYIADWKKELDISMDSTLQLFDQINNIVKIKDIRSFSYGKVGLIEYADPQLMLDEGIPIIIDSKRRAAYIYLPQERYDVRERIKALERIEEINQREYISQLNITKYRDYLKFKKILEKLSIQVVK